VRHKGEVRNERGILGSWMMDDGEREERNASQTRRYEICMTMGAIDRHARHMTTVQPWPGKTSKKGLLRKAR
jgi:hypothetical protein